MKCKYFPCHEGMEDCRQCYCIFYSVCPEISKGCTGGYWLGNVWACERCNIVHKKEVADFIESNITLGRKELLSLVIKKFIKGEKDLKIKVKYFHPDLKRIEKISVGNWIDLRAAADVKLKEGDFALIPLGVAMELPEGYEAHIVPRSSTFKNYGILQVNGVGIIDNSYKGDKDQWFMPVVAFRDTEIKFNDRICQFRIVSVMPDVEFVEVEHLGNENRGGHGSTGRA